MGQEPAVWSDDLEGHERLRCITNYLTRMRLTNAQGGLEFSFKDALDDPMPEGFKPWFEYCIFRLRKHIKSYLVIGQHCRAKRYPTIFKMWMAVVCGVISLWLIVWKISNCLQWIIRWQM